MIAKRGRPVNCFNDLAMKIVRVRSGESNAANPLHCRNAAQQIDKTPPARRGIAIGIHRLPQQLNLSVAGIRKSPGFRDHRFARPAAFRTARVRYHAVRAGIIAAFDNRDVRANRIIPPRDFRFKSLVCIQIQPRDAPPARFKLGQQFWEFSITRRPADQTDPRRPLEDFFTLLLRHASQHADDFSVGNRFPVSQPRENFLRRSLSYAASVVKNQIRLHWIFNRTVSAPQQHARNFLRIVSIHLAAERLYVERSLGL